MLRKGSVTDVIGILTFTSIFVALSFILIIYWDQASPMMDDLLEDAGLNQTQRDNYIEGGADVLSIVPNFTGYLIIVLSLGSIMLSFFVRTSWVFLPLTFIAIVINEVYAIMLSNVMWELMNLDLIAAVANNYPFTVSIIQYFPHIASIVSLCIAIALHIRPSDDGYYG